MIFRPASRQRLTLALLVGALAACGRTVPHGGEPIGAPISEPSAPLAPPSGPDLLPADLDLVVRIDLAKVRAGLGAERSQELAGHALRDTDTEPMVRQALRRADAVWLGLRVADLLEGDRVLVVEAPEGTVKPDPIAWSAQESPREEVRIFDSLAPPVRDGTARILTMTDGTVLFVSPVEVDAVARVLRDGPDAGRGDPAARGLVSVDWRVKPPGIRLQNRFPSLAALMRGIVRFRATITMRANELLLEGRLRCHDEAAAGKVERFLETFAATARRIERYQPLLAALELRRAGSSVTARWALPPEVVLSALRQEVPAPAAAPRH